MDQYCLRLCVSGKELTVAGNILLEGYVVRFLPSPLPLSTTDHRCLPMTTPQRPGPWAAVTTDRPTVIVPGTESLCNPAWLTV